MKFKSQTGISVQNKEIAHITQYEKDKKPDRGPTKQFQLVLWANKKSIMASKYLKWCLTISVVNKRQIKTTYQFGEQENCQYGRLVRWHSQQATYTHLWECKLACWLWKRWHDLLEFRTVHTSWSRNFHPENIPLYTDVCVLICSVMFESLPPQEPQPVSLLCPWRISQARILKRVAISFSRGSCRPREWTCVSWVSCITGRFFTCWAIRDPYMQILLSIYSKTQARVFLATLTKEKSGKQSKCLLIGQQ